MNVIKTLSDIFIKKSLYTGGLMATSGSTSVTWAQLFSSNQNNEELLRIYNEVAEVFAPINYFARNSGNVKFNIYERNAKGEDVLIINTDDKLFKLLTKPNNLQGWNEFYSQTITNYKLFGNVFLNFAAAEGYTPKEIFILPATTQILTNKANYSVDFRRVEIKSYKTEFATINENEVLHLKNTNPNFTNGNFLFGLSELVSCSKAISNIEKGYSVRGSMYENGPEWLVSATDANKKNEYSNAATPDEIKERQKKFSEKYGQTLGKWRFMFLDMAHNATNVSTDLNKLGIEKSNLADFQTICSVIGVPSILLSDTTGSTYSNQAEVSKRWYENEFASLNNSIFEDLTTYVRGIKGWENRIIKPDYSNIPQLQKNVNEKKETYESMVFSGLITRNEYLKKIGEPANENTEFDELRIYNNGSWTELNTNDNVIN